MGTHTTHTGSVLTLANSIIGVSVLAMPFCFKQCGIILSIIMLIVSNVVTRLACYYLIKSAIMEKRKNFEMLAFRVLGPSGKLLVEVCIIGFMLGTCVAFFVVVGDLGPPILAEIIGVQHPAALRPSVLIGLGVFVVLPLALLRNVQSLTTLCAMSIAFYFCLVLKVVGEATSHLLAWDWLDKVAFWRPAGMLQCIPIFSMALSCQMQLFEVFDSLPSTPMERMYGVVRSAVNMTMTFYIAVGFFGYVAFCNQPFNGNLLVNFSPSVISFFIKLGFVLSVAVSFPLVIFPCRASMYSLLFKRGAVSGGGSTVEGSGHIPETKFQCITLLIVTLSLVTGLMVPSIETVLGFVGSTIGVFICIILPSVIFVSLSGRDTSEKLLAKVLAVGGLLTMVLSTYANLYSSDQAVVVLPPEKIIHSAQFAKALIPEMKIEVPEIKIPIVEVKPPVIDVPESGKSISTEQKPNPPIEKPSIENDSTGVKKSLKVIAKDTGKELESMQAQESVKEIVLKKSNKELPPDIKRIGGESRKEPPNPILEEPKKPKKKIEDSIIMKLREELKNKPLTLNEEMKQEKEAKEREEAKMKASIDGVEAVKNSKLEKNETRLDIPASAEVKSEDRVKEMAPIKVIKQENSDLDTDNDKIVPIIKDDIEKKSQVVKSSLVANIAQGIPLPLAIKGNKMVRKELREKRDIETESDKGNQEQCDNDRKVVNIIESESAGMKELIEHSKSDTVLTVKDLKGKLDVPPSHIDSPIANNDNRPRESDDKTNLIKTPLYLSDPKVELVPEFEPKAEVQKIDAIVNIKPDRIEHKK